MAHRDHDFLASGRSARTSNPSSVPEFMWFRAVKSWPSPMRTAPELSNEIDERARRGGVAVLGTGINPGFLMDLLPLALTAPLRRVDHVGIERIQDAGRRRRPFQIKVGAGLNPHDFAKKVGEETPAPRGAHGVDVDDRQRFRLEHLPHRRQRSHRLSPTKSYDAAISRYQRATRSASSRSAAPSTETVSSCTSSSERPLAKRIRAIASRSRVSRPSSPKSRAGSPEISGPVPFSSTAALRDHPRNSGPASHG